MPGLSNVASDYDACCSFGDGFGGILDNRRDVSCHSHFVDVNNACVVSLIDNDVASLAVQVGRLSPSH